MKEKIKVVTKNYKKTYKKYFSIGYEFISVDTFENELSQEPKKLVINHSTKEMYFDF